MKKLLGVVAGIGGIGAGSGLPSLVDTSQKGTLQMNKEDFDGMASGNGRKWCWINVGDGSGEQWTKERDNIFWNVAGGRGLRKLRFAWSKGGKDCKENYKYGGWMWRLQWGWKDGMNIWGSRDERTRNNHEGNVIVGFKWEDGTAVKGRKDGLRKALGGKRQAQLESSVWCNLSKWTENLQGFTAGQKPPIWGALENGREKQDKDCWKRGVQLFDWMWVKGRA